MNTKVLTIIAFLLLCFMGGFSQKKVYIAELTTEDGKQTYAYRDCLNKVKVKLYLRNGDGIKEEIKESKGLSLSVPADEGSVIKFSDKVFGFIPVRPKMRLGVLYEGEMISTYQFNTREVPAPDGFVLKGTNNSILPLDTVKFLKYLLPAGTDKIKLEPDNSNEEFRRTHADDDNYFVSRFSFIIRGSQTIVDGSEISLKGFRLKAGDTLVLGNIKVKRLTYKKDTVNSFGRFTDVWAVVK